MKNNRVKAIWNEQKAKLKQEFAELSNKDLMFEAGQEVEMWMKNQMKLGTAEEDILHIIGSN